MEDGIKHNNPLNWWRIKQALYPLLSQVAYSLLAIPATLAPYERVFSEAGLTIANDRARLSPQCAHEIAFLHETQPAIERFYATYENIRMYQLSF